MRFSLTTLAFASALALGACGGGGGSGSGGAVSSASPAAAATPDFTVPRTFAAVLQNVGENGPADAGRIDALAGAPYDALLIDEIGTSSSAYASTQAAIVSRLHASAGSSLAHKLVFGYVDIGEAESFRAYWQAGWAPGTPSFVLSGTDPNGFAGDYPVNFASPTWQAIVFGSPASLIDRAIADGFDGVYLDWVTGYTFAPVIAANPNAQTTMASFVAAIATYAKAKKPGFTIVAQNARELSTDSRYLEAVDAVLQEDLFFSNSATQAGDIAQNSAVTSQLLTELSALRFAGKPVFSIDYATTSANATSAYTRARSAGVIEYVSDRALGALSSFPPP